MAFTINGGWAGSGESCGTGTKEGRWISVSSTKLGFLGSELHPGRTYLSLEIGITNFIKNFETLFFVKPLRSNITDVNIYLSLVVLWSGEAAEQNQLERMVMCYLSFFSLENDRIFEIQLFPRKSVHYNYFF